MNQSTSLYNINFLYVIQPHIYSVTIKQEGRSFRKRSPNLAFVPVLQKASFQRSQHPCILSYRHVAGIKRNMPTFCSLSPCCDVVSHLYGGLILYVPKILTVACRFQTCFSHAFNDAYLVAS